MQPINNDVLRHVINSSSGNLIITDPKQDDNPIVYASQGYLDLCGYTLDEVLGKNPRFLQGSKTDNKGKTAIRAIIKNKRPGNVVLLNYKKDGSIFWNEVNLFPVLMTNGSVDYWLASHRDVSNSVNNRQTYLDELKALKNSA